MYPEKKNTRNKEPTHRKTKLSTHKNQISQNNQITQKNNTHKTHENKYIKEGNSTQKNKNNTGKQKE